MMENAKDWAIQKLQAQQDAIPHTEWYKKQLKQAAEQVPSGKVRANTKPQRELAPPNHIKAGHSDE